MKVLLSPAMNMNEDLNIKLKKTEPIFKEKTCRIVNEIKKLNPFELESKLNLTPKLYERVFDYYYDFDCTEFSEGTQALHAFVGLAYKNINVYDFTKEEFDFANENLRILSALYGVLKPSDVIKQYRLDFMSTFSKTGMGLNLYDYWGEDIYNEIFSGDEVVIGICSNEYEKMIKPYLKNSDKYISCKFLKHKDGKLKSLATDSKIARGKMARYIIKNNIKELNQIKEFEYDGYRYSSHYSNENTFCFVKIFSS